MLSMSVVHRIELKLPGRSIFDVSLSFRPDAAPELDELAQVAQTHGYRVMRGSFSVIYSDNVPVWRFFVVSLDRSRSTSPAQMAQGLARSGDVLRFSIVPLKN